MRVAYFGGSFDPPHPGHLRLALAARDRLGCNEVLLAPTGKQPLKKNEAPPASFADRVAMLKLLIGAEHGFSISTVDAPREDGEPNFSADTLDRLRPTLPEGTELLFLAGADTFLSLRHWQRAPELLQTGGLLEGWIVAARPGFPLDTLGSSMPDGFLLEGAPDHEHHPSVLLVREDGSNAPGLPVYLFTDMDDPTSATSIRSALAEGRDAGLSPEILAYIRDHGLYRVLR